jgi:hypothetical protein
MEINAAKRLEVAEKHSTIANLATDPTHENIMALVHAGAQGVPELINAWKTLALAHVKFGAANGMPADHEFMDYHATSAAKLDAYVVAARKVGA